MTTRYDILPETHRGLLPDLAPLKDLGFVLYGGTAIALRLGHLIPVDFEFATDRPLDRAALAVAMPGLAKAVTLHDEPDARTVEMLPNGSASEAVRISFATVLGRVGVPELDADGRLLLASPDDLLGQKLGMLLRRVDTNDFRDIAALLGSGLTLGRGLGAAKTLFPEMPLSEAIKALVYFEAEELGELSAAERTILVGDAARVTTVADMPLLSRHLDNAGPVA